MPTNIKNYISKEYQMKLAVAAPSGAFTIGEVVGNNAVQGSATALGVLKEIQGTAGNTVFILDSIQGTAIFADADTVTGYTSTETAVVDSVADAGSFVLDGSDIHITESGIERHTVTAGGRTIKEVLVASRTLATKQAA
jgi:hypothetical protein